MELVKITPNIEKAKSILAMVDKTREMINTIDFEKFSSNVTKEYYEIVRELMAVVLLLDGFKAYGEGAHVMQIDYCKSLLEEDDIILIESLRKLRNRIAYDGFFVDKDYIIRKKDKIELIINKLNKIISDKL